MPDTESPATGHPSPATQHGHPAKGIPGPVMILGSVLGCVVLLFIVWATLRSVEHHLDASRPDLVWADRANWHTPSVTETTLVKPNAANAQYTYNKPRYRDPEFVISVEEEQIVLACADLARSPDFTNDTTRQGVLQHAGDKTLFYPQYLLGLWHQQNTNPRDAEACFQHAIDNAPIILVIQYTDANGKPVPALKLDRVEIGCDRVTHEGQTLDQRLVLVYPHLETDATGRIYLPVYDTTYRPVHLPQPDGYTIKYTSNEGWFKTVTKLGLLSAVAQRQAN